MRKGVEFPFPGEIILGYSEPREGGRGFRKRLADALCSALREGALWIKFKSSAKNHWGLGDGEAGQAQFSVAF